MALENTTASPNVFLIAHDRATFLAAPKVLKSFLRVDVASHGTSPVERSTQTGKSGSRFAGPGLCDFAGDYGRHLLNALRSPAHKADIFCNIYPYFNGGLDLDIKCCFSVPFPTLLDIMSKEWGTAEHQAQQALGHCPSPPGVVPPEYILMAIGNAEITFSRGLSTKP